MIDGGIMRLIKIEDVYYNLSAMVGFSIQETYIVCYCAPLPIAFTTDEKILRRIKQENDEANKALKRTERMLGPVKELGDNVSEGIQWVKISHDDFQRLKNAILL